MAKLPISASENAQVLGFLFGLGFFFFFTWSLRVGGRSQVAYNSFKLAMQLKMRLNSEPPPSTSQMLDYSMPPCQPKFPNTV